MIFIEACNDARVPAATIGCRGADDVEPIWFAAAPTPASRVFEWGTVEDNRVADQLRVAQSMLLSADMTMTEETSAQATLLRGRVELV
jgi:hypothetical protein